MYAKPKFCRSYDEWMQSGESKDILDARVGPTPETLLLRVQEEEASSNPATPTFVLAVIKNTSRAPLHLDFGHGKYVSRPSAGEMVLQPANQDCRIEGSHACPLQYELIIWNGAELGRRIEEAINRPFESFGSLHASVFRQAQIERLVSMLWRTAAQLQIAAERLRYEGMLSMLAGELVLLSKQFEPKTRTQRTLTPESIARLREYIDAHLHRSIGQDELAALADTPSLIFHRVFKASVGDTPHRYVTRLRIERACLLLRDQRQPLIDVALACGFCDQGHMTRVFNQHLGITPGHFRRTLTSR
jgi:AraC-like DNA-binding protein